MATPMDAARQHRHRPGRRNAAADRVASPAVRVVIGALAVVAVVGMAAAQDSRSVPADFVSFISPPGVLDRIERPSAIAVDRAQGEVFIADPGHNRIVVFDADGGFRFEFSVSECTAMPLDLAVDSQGFITMIGSTRDGQRLFRFDFDGLFLGQVPRPVLPDGRVLDVDHVDIDARDRLVLLDRDALMIAITEPDGSLVSSFDLVPVADRDARQDLVPGAITVAGDRLYVPFSSRGTVAVFTLDGEPVTFHGYKGNNPGELNFPTAVAVSDDLVAILDKHRFNVVCFGHDGVFRGEFGGRGVSPGWFYHPTLLELGPDRQAYIGQIFENRIQICRIPDFIVIGRTSGDANADATRGS